MKVFRNFIIISLLSFIFAVRPAIAQRRIALVDINRAVKTEFARLPGVSEELAETIIKYRQENDYFDDIEELLEVEGMTREIYDGILPYLTFSPPGSQRADEIITDLETMEEEEEEYFLDMGVDISRLELYRNNPLDINTAVYSQFLELPGIEPQHAEAIIELRKEKQGFESVDELKEVLTEDTFEMILPFIAVLDEEELAQLHGDVRITADVTYPYDDYYFDLDEKYHYPLQIEMRHRLKYGNKLEFGFQMRRKASPNYSGLSYDGAMAINYENFNEYFLGTRYMLVRNVGPADTLVLGSYRLDYLKPATRTRDLKGLRMDDRASINSGFYGAAAELRIKNWEITPFYSQKEFAIEDINEYDGSVAEHPRNFYYSGNYPIFKPPYLTETLYGGIIRRPLGNLTLSAGGYLNSFSKVIDPAEPFYRFRGDKINILDVEAEYAFRNIQFIADGGFSWNHTFDADYVAVDVSGTERYLRDWSAGRDWYWDLGTAMRLTLLSNHDKANFWAYYWTVDYNYFDMLGEGYDATYNGRNENRYSVGARVEPKKNMYTQAEFIFQELRKPVNETVSVYVGGDRVVNTPTQYGDDNLLTFKLRQSWDITKKFLLRYTGTFRNKDEWRTNEIRFSPMYSASHRLELTHRASDKIKLRAVFKKSKEQFDQLNYLQEYDTDDGNYGELRYRPTGPLVVKARVFVQESGYGLGWSLKPTLSLSKNAKLKLEYEQEPKADGGFGSTFLAQYDMAW